jgi:hypothetical protein
VGFNKVWVLRLFLTIVLDLKTFLFILIMKKNVKLVMQKPFDINSLTKLWKTLSSSQILEQKINEYIRFVGLGIMQVIN